MDNLDTWDKIFDYQSHKDGANYHLLKDWLKKYYDVPKLKEIEDVTDLIIVEDGDIFYGTREQFSDCFFTNSTDDEIADWCFDNDWKLVINNEQIL